MIETVACPRRSETTLGWTPACSARVAWVWRRSWRRIVGQHGLLHGLAEVARDALGVEGGAVFGSEHQAGLDPAASHSCCSSSCRAACAFKTSTVPGSMAMTRRPLAVLGSLTTTSRLTGMRARRTESRPASRSTSIQRRPSRLAAAHAGHGDDVPKRGEAFVFDAPPGTP